MINRIKSRRSQKDSLNTKPTLRGDHSNSIRSLIEDSKTTFVVDFSEVELLMANNFYLHSIFLNLITNSIKFAKPGMPPVITIISEKETNGCQIRFSDNGIGFDMEKNKNKLFGLNQVFTNRNDSKGVGLYLVKNWSPAFYSDRSDFTGLFSQL